MWKTFDTLTAGDSPRTILQKMHPFSVFSALELEVQLVTSRGLKQFDFSGEVAGRRWEDKRARRRRAGALLSIKVKPF